jgi:hypothetical protein
VTGVKAFSEEPPPGSVGARCDVPPHESGHLSPCRRGYGGDVTRLSVGSVQHSDSWIAPGLVEARVVGSDVGEDRVLTVVLDRLGRPVVGLELGVGRAPSRRAGACGWGQSQLLAGGRAQMGRCAGRAPGEQLVHKRIPQRRLDDDAL